MIRFLITLFLSFYLNAQFLEDNEIERLKRGKTYKLQYKAKEFVLNYDIWRAAFILDEDSIKKRFKVELKLFEYLKIRYDMKYIFIVETERNSQESDIFLFDLVDSVIRKFKRRKIDLDEEF